MHSASALAKVSHRVQECKESPLYCTSMMQSCTVFMLCAGRLTHLAVHYSHCTAEDAAATLHKHDLTQIARTPMLGSTAADLVLVHFLQHI